VARVKNINNVMVSSNNFIDIRTNENFC
jgi:hypothetical protein